MRPTYDFYREEHMGALGEDEFRAAAPLATARLQAMTGPVDASSRHADAWLHAACALVDLAAGADGSGGTVASETVGGTTVVYAQAAQRGAADAEYAAVAPWLAGTGLLCQVLG